MRFIFPKYNDNIYVWIEEEKKNKQLCTRSYSACVRYAPRTITHTHTICTFKNAMWNSHYMCTYCLYNNCNAATAQEHIYFCSVLAILYLFNFQIKVNWWRSSSRAAHWEFCRCVCRLFYFLRVRRRWWWWQWFCIFLSWFSIDSIDSNISTRFNTT